MDGRAMSDWKSSTLRFCSDEEDCKICRFVGGDRSEDVMLEVIRILDANLAAKEEVLRGIFRVMIADHADKR